MEWDISAEIAAVSSRRGKRMGEIELWRKNHPDEAKQFDSYVDQFVSARKDGSTCSYMGFYAIIADRLTLKVSQNTLTKWIRELHPDEPSLRY